eukprot:TRINITY_DN56946_c0_g1_i1.p1 TRINITY_DN56946_c0_g1~~TRINITY_DN56946_c0_g1_i1.p1  ORF type:complete len:311 (-),score=16.59 TRINITY_DN56946_c0_g1_i1:122-1054(-)
MAPATLDNLASLLYTVLGKLDRLEHTQRVLREQHDLILGHLSISKFRPSSAVDLDGPDPYQPFRDFREYQVLSTDLPKGDFSVLGIQAPTELPALVHSFDEGRSKASNKVDTVPTASRPSSRARVLRASPLYLPPEALDGEWCSVSTPSSNATAAARPRSSRPKERPVVPDPAGTHQERAATAPSVSSGERNPVGLPASGIYRQHSDTATRPQAPPPPPSAMTERGTAMNALAEPIYYPVDMPTGQRVYRRTPAEPAVRARSARVATPPLAPLTTVGSTSSSGTSRPSPSSAHVQSGVPALLPDSGNLPS